MGREREISHLESDAAGSIQTRERMRGQLHAESRNLVWPQGLQFVNEDETCEFTGLGLIDIWRYFRHTWVTPYSLPPGRKILILVRDRAVANHPVMALR